MKNEGPAVSSFGVDRQGITDAGTVYWNLPPARLVELAVQRGEASLAAEGPLVCVTGQHTGRSPNDKFVVKDPATDGDIWWGEVNRPFEREKFDALLARAREYMKGKDLFVFDGYAGADPEYRIKVRVITDDAWRNLFARNMFSPEGEPEIYATTRAFGTILENVVCDPETRRLDLDSDRLTENTRSSYPLTQLHNVDLQGMAGHPRNVIFLTCDAFGVLPPVSRLTEEQAMYHFLSGYTAKVAGTERGVTEPKVTFSTCFGSPFLPLHPGVYAKMLGEKLEKHGAKVWLLNTGWTGGPYGVGQRIKLGFTRRMVTAALSGELDHVETRTDPIFGLAVPVRIDGVPDMLLHPRETWHSPADYDAQASKLADMFADNFKKYESGVDEAVKAAGPSRVRV